MTAALLYALPGEGAYWIAGASAVAAWIAAIIAGFSVRTSRKALKLAEEQDLRRRADMTLYVRDGYARRNSVRSEREYAFLVSVTNRSDSNNSIVEFDLRIKYRTKQHFVGDVGLPSLGGVDLPPGAMQSPIRVEAHDTVAGWIHFKHDLALLAGCDVDNYSLVAMDSHRERSSVEISMIREIFDEVETNQV